MKNDKGKKEKQAPDHQAPVSDITDGGVLQNHAGIAQVTQELLRLFATKATKKAYLDAVAELSRSWSGCGSVGVRVLDRDGRIPYESTLGFSAGFCTTESPISLRTDRCACTRIIAGSPLAPDLPYMTNRGSFHCNDTNRFLGSLSEAEKGDYRGVCMTSGYASVAVVPIRYRDRIIGAIHVADTGKAHVPLEMVEFLEAAGAVVGEAIYRLNLEEDLRKSEENYRGIFENAIEGIFQIEPDGRFLSLNPALVRMLGYESTEEVLEEPSARLRFIDPEREREFHQRLEAEGIVQGFETELAQSRGTPAWVSVNARAVRDRDGGYRFMKVWSRTSHGGKSPRPNSSGSPPRSSRISRVS